jgi:hypothetical protein
VRRSTAAAGEAGGSHRVGPFKGRAMRELCPPALRRPWAAVKLGSPRRPLDADGGAFIPVLSRRLRLKRLACLLLLLAMASTANAGGIGLRWGSCEGTANRNFACTGSSGSELLVGSFNPSSGVDQLSGIEVILSIAAADGNTPSWWQTFDSGGCRRGSIAASFDVSDQSECDDPWNGQAVGGIGNAAALRVSDSNVDNATGIDLYLTAAVAPAQIQGVSSGRTYAAFKILINHQKSSGPGACSGCDTPVCITFDAIRLAQPGRKADQDGRNAGTIYTVMTDGIGGMGGASQVATWQGGSANCTAGLAKPSTWAQLKSRFKTTK